MFSFTSVLPSEGDENTDQVETYTHAHGSKENKTMQGLPEIRFAGWACKSAEGQMVSVCLAVRGKVDDGAGEEGSESKKLVGNLLSAEITGRETRLNLLLIAAQPNWQGDHFWASSLADKRTINYQQGDGNSLHLGTWLTKILHNLTLGTNQLELGTALHLGTNIVLLN